MELRKDPLTRSWVLTGDDIPETAPRPAAECRLCPGAKDRLQQISSRAALPGQPGSWSARAVVHPAAVYHIEGDAERRGHGLYDRMPPLGAHEVLVENPKHDRQLWQASDSEIEQFLLLAAQRIQDLKGDQRFRYISVFKNHGPGAGQEFEHPSSPRPRLFPAACSTNCARGSIISKIKNAAYSATCWPRRCSSPSGSLKCAGILWPSAPTPH